MSSVVPGPNDREPAPHQLGACLGGGHRRDAVREPGVHRAPIGAGCSSTRHAGVRARPAARRRAGRAPGSTCRRSRPTSCPRRPSAGCGGRAPPWPARPRSTRRATRSRQRSRSRASSATGRRPWRCRSTRSSAPRACAGPGPARRSPRPGRPARARAGRRTSCAACTASARGVVLVQRALDGGNRGARALQARRDRQVDRGRVGRVHADEIARQRRDIGRFVRTARGGDARRGGPDVRRCRCDAWRHAARAATCPAEFGGHAPSGLVATLVC